MKIQRKNEMPNTFYWNMTATGCLFLIQVVLGRNNWLLLTGNKRVLYLIIRRLNLDVVNQFSHASPVFFGYRRKWGVTSLSFSQQGSIHHINK